MRRRHRYPLEELVIPPPSDAGAVEQEVVDETTGQVTQRLFASMQAAPHEADVIVDKLVERLSARVRRDSSGDGGGRRRGPDLKGWLGLIMGALLALLGAWWALAQRFGERPTLSEVRRLVEPLEQRLHEDEAQIRQTGDTLIRVEATMKQLGETLGEVRQDVKDLRRSP